MTDNDTPFDETFAKETVKRFGARGSPVFEQEEKHVDLDRGRIRTEQTGVPICTCGAPLTATGQVYRCCSCELIGCPRCVIRLHRRHFCPTCAQQEYALDKHVVVSLLFIKHDVLEPDDLTQVETAGDSPVAITVDHAADPFVDNGYVEETGELTTDGREALAVGKQLYGEDEDVRSLLRTVRVRTVANQGG